MSRKWSARKSTTLVEEAIDASRFPIQHAIYRVEPVTSTARHKECLRFLLTWVFMGFPIQFAVHGIVALSPLGGVLALGALSLVLFGVALVKWLAMNALVQALPAMAFGFIVVGLVYSVFCGVFSITAENLGQQVSGIFVTLLGLALVANLCRPICAIYQSMTLRMSAGQIFLVATGLLGFLALALVVYVAPGSLVFLIGSGMTGAVAGLVVFEYAAWAQANPNQSLARVRAFYNSSRPLGQFLTPSTALTVSLVGTFLACLVAGYGLQIRTDGASLTDLWLWASVLAIAGAVVMVGAILGTHRRRQRSSAALRAWDALCVFATYPNPRVPLAYRMRVPVFRSLLVRKVAVCVALAVLQSGVVSVFWPPTMVRLPDLSSPGMTVPTASALDGIGSLTMEPEIQGVPQAVPTEPALQPKTEPASASAEASGQLNVRRLVLLATALSPFWLLALVLVLGFKVLPSYHAYFEA